MKSLVEPTAELALVAGVRPNFMKVTPILRAVDQVQPGCSTVLVHTGQHHSADLSELFFEQLGIRRSDVHLEAGEPDCRETPPVVAMRPFQIVPRHV